LYIFSSRSVIVGGFFVNPNIVIVFKLIVKFNHCF
jgi:hypothetical protein